MLNVEEQKFLKPLCMKEIQTCMFYMLPYMMIFVAWKPSYISFSEQVDHFPLENSMKFVLLSLSVLAVLCINSVFMIHLHSSSCFSFALRERARGRGTSERFSHSLVQLLLPRAKLESVNQFQ